jgi:hypothetical protein
MSISSLKRQFEIAWKLTRYHLENLTTAECLWRPAAKGLHVHKSADGLWRADWPESEGYDLGPPSIAWLTWHIIFWWSMALNHNFGDETLTREDIPWPGSAETACEQIESLQIRWRENIDMLNADDLRSTERTRWPFKDRPFEDVVAWVNIELTKNASEIGYARFLYAVRSVKY